MCSSMVFNRVKPPVVQYPVDKSDVAIGRHHPCHVSRTLYPRATISICGVTSELAIIGESLALAFLGNGERTKPARHSVEETYEMVTLLQRIMIMWNYFIHSHARKAALCPIIPYLIPQDSSPWQWIRAILPSTVTEAPFLALWMEEQSLTEKNKHISAVGPY